MLYILMIFYNNGDISYIFYMQYQEIILQFQLFELFTILIDKHDTIYFIRLLKKFNWQWE